MQISYELSVRQMGKNVSGEVVGDVGNGAGKVM